MLHLLFSYKSADGVDVECAYILWFKQTKPRMKTQQALRLPQLTWAKSKLNMYSRRAKAVPGYVAVLISTISRLLCIQARPKVDDLFITTT